MKINLSICLILAILYSANCLPSKNAGLKLKALRDEMTSRGIHAYIIPSQDEHQSEYVSKYDTRREWISGFTGSAGVAVVTLNNASLWTDSRYYLRADKELNKDFWKLMKSGEATTPSIEDWLKSILSAGNTVGQYAKLVSISGWKSRFASLAAKGIFFNDTVDDLIDKIWTVDRPPKPSSEIKIHKIEFSGRAWTDKVSDVIEKIKETGADLYVVTALDEVAWLFNLRASDIPYNPMLLAYGIVDINGDTYLFVNKSRLNNDLENHLKNVKIYEYEEITKEISRLSSIGKKIWISPSSSYAIYNAVTNQNLLINDKLSPVRILKSVKNRVEIENARLCHIRDSAARIKHMYWLENEILKGNRVTEVSSANELEKIQKLDPLCPSLSFDSISAVGPHASDIHFSTNEEENLNITTGQIYLLDAGAQYEDCTTDVTRTHHWGRPKPKEILAYTKVLQGSIDLANLVFPRDVNGRLIDVAARAPLWQAGLDYGHGTGHGIGYYLSVHENPPYGSSVNEFYVPGMFQSDEPGYYEDNVFGIRLETDLEVVEANTTYNFGGKKFLKFEPHTLVPFDRNLIDMRLLTKYQIAWLNEYNEKIRAKVGPLLKSNKAVYDYLMDKTQPFKFEVNASTIPLINFKIMILFSILSIITKYALN